MAKRALIMYFTMTGNTTKVANRFQEVFKKRGWECDVLKVDRKTNVTQSPSPYDCNKYDLFCIGSGSYKSMPGEPLIDMMRNNPQDIHYNPRLENGQGSGGVAPQFGPDITPGQPPPFPAGSPPPMNHRKLVMTPEWKKGIVFVTFGGQEFGWPEAVPALESLALEMAHMKIQCIGKFSCPGRFGPQNDTVWFKDLHTRPNERDLQSAEIFLERALDDVE
jgi:hypothetical protein